MNPDPETRPAAAAIEEFNRQAKRTDGTRVVASLNDGMSLLRDTLLERIHGDVEQRLGVDSMLMPLSELKTRQQSHLETDLYQLAECALAVRAGGYVPAADAWFPGWLIRLRFDPSRIETHAARVEEYLGLSADERRLKFTDVLAHVVPESRRAPLVLFRLFPLAVHIVTQVAWGDLPAAGSGRKQQWQILPAIGDCHQCRGRVLDNGQQCAECGNPLWKSPLLTATD
jgi:hypothetical protein